MDPLSADEPWAVPECADAKRGDLRRTPRLGELATVLAQRPSASLPEAGGGARARLPATDRFFDTATLAPQDLLQSQSDTTIERVPPTRFSSLGDREAVPVGHDRGRTGGGTPYRPGAAFVEGASPYECLDRAGNVWEWTCSLWGEERRPPTFTYPYNPDDGRENLRAADDTLRVRRGSAFSAGLHGVRCAYHYRCGVRDVLNSVGFRVVVRPCL